MATEQQKRDYLDDHLQYALKMLRYTYGQTLQEQHYLSWMRTSGHLRFRHLVNFLANNDTENFKGS
jgi:hypothetical protein